MKSKLSALVVLALGLSLGNCDLLGVKLIDTEDFSIKDFKPSPSAKFIKGLEFTSATVVDELLGAGKDADLEIPLLGDAMKKAGAPGGLIILAKEVKYKGDYKWQLAALIKFEGDKLQYKQQKFPAASGEGKYGMFYALTKYAFVTGVAVDCSAKAKSGIWVISGNNHNYLTKTNGSGKYGLPFEVGSEGKSVSLSIADEECGGGGAVSVPMGEPGAETVDKVVEDESGNETEEKSDCDMAPAEGGSETVTEAPEAQPLRAEGDAREEPPATLNVCTDMKVIALNATGQPSELDPTDAANDSTTVCDSTALVISTGGNNVKGTAAALDFKPAGLTSVTVTYRILSQEFPQYALGAFNDAIGIGFVGANEPGAVDSVGVRQSSKDMIWNFPTADCAGQTKCGYSFITSTEEIGTTQFAGLDLENSADSTKKSKAHGGETRFGGVTNHDGNTSVEASITKTVEIPRNIATQDTATFLIAIGDVGDAKFDSALRIESVVFE